MRSLFFSLLASAAVACPIALPPAAAAQQLAPQAAPLSAGSAHFTIVQDKKTVGSADYTIAADPGGYLISSRGETQKYHYTFNNANKLDPSLNVVHDQLSGDVKGSSVTFTMASDSTGRSFQVNIAASGKNTQTTFDRHQRTVLLADLDPAAYVEMAHFALQHPPTAWIVIPKGEGVLVPADYEPQPDAEGSWNGRTATVHHTSVIVNAQNGITVELYYTDSGDLLEADLPEQNFWIIRDGFDLHNRPKYQPPHSSTPPPDQQNQQSQPQGASPQYQAPQGGYPQLQRQ
ncbi:hypothetical protein [Paracidobacterium acidisoli]|uniref:DUF3108 domain-containing protein n=1 Tax=Paracidobacterium acidisoli TaxID=2303751 RepID=A0A372INW9_9BACT|nr:hypothetical protein [Paracidobacterium acidisoli]MBT9330941.1 hypothetical protein [Paracidobacterium acidisoli]